MESGSSNNMDLLKQNVSNVTQSVINFDVICLWVYYSAY